MKVIAAINGSVISESMALYALKYAEIQNLSLVLLHVRNSKDPMERVESSVRRLSELAASKNVKTDFILLSPPLKRTLGLYLSTVHADILFCATRKENPFLRSSFSEQLLRMGLNTDIAVARIVKMTPILDLQKIALSIIEDRLSVKKFTFFTTHGSTPSISICAIIGNWPAICPLPSG